MDLSRTTIGATADQGAGIGTSQALLPALPLQLDAVAGRFLRGILIIAAAVGFGSLLWDTVTLLVGGILGGVLILCTLILWFVAAAHRSDLAAFRRGQYLLAWTYNAPDWENISAHETRQNRKTFLTAVGMGLVAGALSGVIIADQRDPYGADPVLYAGVLGLVGVGVMAGLAAMMGWLGPAFGSSGPAVPPLFVLGPRGFYLNGSYYRWQDFGRRLASVEVAGTRPDALHFRFRQVGRHGHTIQTVRVPVPAGRETDVQDILNGLVAARVPVTETTGRV